MADMPVEQGKQRTDTWVIAAVAAAALICVSLVAVALASILAKGGSSAPAVNANPVITINSAPAAVPTPGITRPSEPAKPQANRSPAENVRQPALPGAVASAPGQVQRADPKQRPGAEALPSPDKKVFLRVRGEATNLYKGKAALPMPVSHRADPSGKVDAVYASRQPASRPLPPDRNYADAGAHGSRVDLQVQEPRSTGRLDGYYAPEGFSFFTAKISVRNVGAEALKLDLGDFEVRDADGTPYLANPELSQGLADGGLASQAGLQATLSFLVSDASPLSALVLNLPEGPVQLTLSRR